MKIVLFLCTGNYYRSRFAEELFNHRAARDGLGWLAQSSGLATERLMNHVGPLSPFALKALEERGVVARFAHRMPRQCTIVDLTTADYVVALNESEHRPLIRERFGDWGSQIEYWQISDIDVVPPDVALSSIDSHIDALLARLWRDQELAMIRAARRRNPEDDG